MKPQPIVIQRLSPRRRAARAASSWATCPSMPTTRCSSRPLARADASSSCASQWMRQRRREVLPAPVDTAAWHRWPGTVAEACVCPEQSVGPGFSRRAAALPRRRRPEAKAPHLSPLPALTPTPAWARPQPVGRPCRRATRVCPKMASTARAPPVRVPPRRHRLLPHSCDLL